MMDSRSPSLRRINAAFWLAIVAVIITLGTLGGSYVYLRREQAAQQQLMQQLSAQLQALTARLDSIDAQNKKTDVNARLTALETRITGFASIADRFTEQSKVLQAVAERVTTLDAAQHQAVPAATDAAVPPPNWQLALTNLNAKADAAQPFTAEYQQLAAIAPPALISLLQGIGNLATNPPPSLPQLRAMLNSQALAHHAASGTHASQFWVRVKTYLQNFVSIRPLPNNNADTTTFTGKIAKALYSLDQHDLGQALAATANTPELAGWHDLLAQRIDLDEAIGKLASADVTSTKAPDAAPPALGATP